MIQAQSFDLIILGGGLVGLAAANLCADKGFRVAVVEKNKPVQEISSAQMDPRCSAISRRSEQMFNTLGIWEKIETVSPYDRMIVWEEKGFGEIIFQASEVGEVNLGHIIENQHLLGALWERAIQDSNIQLFVGKKPVSCDIDEKRASICLEENGRIQASLIIGADGKYSWLRKTMGIGIEEKDYHQTAIVVTVKTEKPHQRTAWQRFLVDGPLAFLPLSDPNLCSIVWTTSPQKAKTLTQLSETQFNQELSHAFDYRLGKVLWASKPQHFPLSRLQANHYVMDRIALLGDAAHVVHPMAGQGVNLGFYGAMCLLKALSCARDKGLDIGLRNQLRPYERAHKSYMISTMAALDMLKNLFGSSSDFINDLRGVGLDMVNHSLFVKKLMIKQAMGI